MGIQRAGRLFFPVFAVLFSSVYLSSLLTAQDPGTTLDSPTWQQDSPVICTGCVYRTGGNLGEKKITYGSISTSTFGQFCNYTLDGQVYGQPLVAHNVTFNGVAGKTVVYVVTQNDSVYAFDGKPSQPSGYPVPSCTLLAGPVSLVLSGESAVNCSNLGAGSCITIAQEIGIVGTPVIQITGINPTTGNIYVVAQSVSGTTYYHRVWSLDISSLSLQTAIHNTINNIPSSCPQGTKPFSQIHIQRPALLLGGDNYLYVAFSMMDGITHPLPNGMVLAYNTASFSATAVPLCIAASAGQNGADGAGIWQGGAGPAYGPDSSATTSYVYFNTGNGVYDGSSNWGDSFIEMTTAGSGALQVNGAFTPVDQLSRSGGMDYQGTTCTPDDIDYGSGGVMLIPEENVKYPYLAVSGDKEGGIWFVDRTTPSGYNGDGSCLGTTHGGTGNKNVETYPINGTSRSDSGPVVHTSPAFWENSSGTSTNYLFMGSQVSYSGGSQIAGSGRLMRYQICSAGNPIHNQSPTCTTAGAYAYDSSTGLEIDFPWGVTPTVTAYSPTDTDALLWGIWADGSVVPNTDKFTYKTNTFNPSVNGVLYAFDAANTGDSNMKKLYGSNDCKDSSGHLLDQINPATKYSVPNIVNGYVYLGTQGARYASNSNGSFPNNLDFNQGTFYIFGVFSNPTRTCS